MLCIETQNSENARTGCYPEALQAPVCQLQSCSTPWDGIGYSRGLRLAPRQAGLRDVLLRIGCLRAVSSNKSDHASCTLRKDCTRGNACSKDKSNTCLRRRTSMDEVETVAWSGTYDENGLPHGKVPAGCQLGSRTIFLSSCLTSTGFMCRASCCIRPGLLLTTKTDQKTSMKELLRPDCAKAVASTPGPAVLHIPANTTRI